MNLLQIRQQFRTLSGRNDLVTAAGASTGADFYINAGMKWLDIQRFETKKSIGRVFRMVAAGGYAVTFPLCRAIKEVWGADTTNGRWQLYKLDAQDYRTEFYDIPSNRDAGQPLYYTPAYLRSVPESERVAIEDFNAIIGYADIMVGANYEYNGVVFTPPVELETMIEVWGRFYTEELTEDTHENYWTLVHPSILIAATLREVEIFNRNTQGVNDMTAAIMDKLSGIDMDIVDEDQSEVSQMGG